MSDLTPCSKSQKPSDESPFHDQLPSTPRLPFNPPRRRSSLGFSRILDSPITENNRESPRMDNVSAAVCDLPDMQPEKRNQETIEAPSRFSGAIPGHVAQVQKVFQAARANLQLDMHFAASPIGSIESRLPQLDHNDSERVMQDLNFESCRTPWRYSTLPRLLSTTTSDVREPLPDGSPSLPAHFPTQVADDYDLPTVEPTSSGFASPLGGDDRDDHDNLMYLPPLPSSSSTQADFDRREDDDTYTTWHNSNEDVSGLMQPMTGLRVDTGQVQPSHSPADQVHHALTSNKLWPESNIHDDQEMDMPESSDTIFLSRSAKAAAESAKEKRDLLKKAFGYLADKENLNPNMRAQISSAHCDPAAQCPDPELHHYLATTPCPNPLAHIRVKSPETRAGDSYNMRKQPCSLNDAHSTSGAIKSSMQDATSKLPRTTAEGSPMPFTRRGFGHAAGNKNVRLAHPQHLASVTSKPNSHRAPHSLMYKPQQMHKPRDHFQPGWYYADKQAMSRYGTGPDLYSFSTAAAKATGESVAPDSRIRNSYRTDTLMPMIPQPGRYRKNGIAASMPPYNALSHTHSRAPRQKPMNMRTLAKRQNPKPQDRQELGFKSSPPRPSIQDYPTHNLRKRGLNDSEGSDFDVSEDLSASAYYSDSMQPSEDTMQIDEETRAAVRMSVFGSETPECLQGPREGIRELSPNVDVWRKGLSGNPHYRKKRRPSYWDDDLEEVRMSPAGRGGIASSPVISKRSMAAELDTASSRADTTMHEQRRFIHNDLMHSGEVVVNDVEEAIMTDPIELEA